MNKLISFLFIFFVLVGQAWGATYTVCASGCNETTIQAIFDNNDLAPGDIVEIQADTVGGSKTYTEAIVVGANDQGDSGSQLIIRGRSGDSVSINADSGTNGFLATTRSYLTIQNLTVTNAGYAFRFSGAGIIVIDCNATESSMGFRFTAVTSGSVSGCTAEDHTTTNGGFLFESATVMTVSDCTSKNGDTNEAHGYRILGTGTIVIFNDSYAYNNDGDGWNVGAADANTPAITCNRCVAYSNGNTSQVNSGDGYTSHGASTMNLYSCLVYSNQKSGASVTNESSGNIYNCTFYDNYEATNPDDYGIWVNATGTWNIKNNIFKNHRSEIYVSATAITGAVTLDLSNNCYDDSRGGFCFHWNGSDHNSLAAFISDAATDGYTVGANSLDAAPLLNANYTLQSSSPCINAGTKSGTVGLSGKQTDGFGNSYFFTPYDRLNIGADQNYSDAALRASGGMILK